MPSASDGDGAWARVIGGIRMNFEDHVTAGVAGAMIGIYREIVEETPGGFDSASSGVRLSGGDVIAGGEDERVLHSSVIQEIAIYLLGP